MGRKERLNSRFVHEFGCYSLKSPVISSHKGKKKALDRHLGHLQIFGNNNSKKQ